MLPTHLHLFQNILVQHNQILVHNWREIVPSPRYVSYLVCELLYTQYLALRTLSVSVS